MISERDEWKAKYEELDKAKKPRIISGAEMQAETAKTVGEAYMQASSEIADLIWKNHELTDRAETAEALLLEYRKTAENICAFCTHPFCGNKTKIYKGCKFQLAKRFEVTDKDDERWKSIDELDKPMTEEEHQAFLKRWEDRGYKASQELSADEAMSDEVIAEIMKYATIEDADEPLQDVPSKEYITVNGKDYSRIISGDEVKDICEELLAQAQADAIKRHTEKCKLNGSYYCNNECQFFDWCCRDKELSPAEQDAQLLEFFTANNYGDKTIDDLKQLFEDMDAKGEFDDRQQDKYCGVVGGKCNECAIADNGKCDEQVTGKLENADTATGLCTPEDIGKPLGKLSVSNENIVTLKKDKNGKFIPLTDEEISEAMKRVRAKRKQQDNQEVKCEKCAVYERAFNGTCYACKHAKPLIQGLGAVTCDEMKKRNVLGGGGRKSSCKKWEFDFERFKDGDNK